MSFDPILFELMSFDSMLFGPMLFKLMSFDYKLFDPKSFDPNAVWPCVGEPIWEIIRPSLVFDKVCFQINSF